MRAGSYCVWLKTQKNIFETYCHTKHHYLQEIHKIHNIFCEELKYPPARGDTRDVTLRVI